MREFLIFADEHTQFFVINADVIFYHVTRHLTIQNIILYEIKYHVGVIHRGCIVTLGSEAVIIIPRLHNLNDFINAMVEVAGGGIIRQHLTNLVFGEAHHFIKLG